MFERAGGYGGSCIIGQAIAFFQEWKESEPIQELSNREADRPPLLPTIAADPEGTPPVARRDSRRQFSDGWMTHLRLRCFHLRLGDVTPVENSDNFCVEIVPAVLV